jgi:hypothetical protein
MNAALDINNVGIFLDALLASGVGIVLVAQLVKKLFGMDSEKAIHAMVVGVSALSSVVAYVLQFKGLPLTVLGISVPASYGVSQVLYKTAKYVSDYLPSVQDVLNKVSSLLHKKPASAAAVPSVNVPSTIASDPSAASTNNEFNA